MTKCLATSSVGPRSSQKSPNIRTLRTSAAMSKKLTRKSSLVFVSSLPNCEIITPLYTISSRRISIRSNCREHRMSTPCTERIIASEHKQQFVKYPVSPIQSLFQLLPPISSRFLLLLFLSFLLSHFCDHFLNLNLSHEKSSAPLLKHE